MKPSASLAIWAASMSRSTCSFGCMWVLPSRQQSHPTLGLRDNARALGADHDEHRCDEPRKAMGLEPDREQEKGCQGDDDDPPPTRLHRGGHPANPPENEGPILQARNAADVPDGAPGAVKPCAIGEGMPASSNRVSGHPARSRRSWMCERGDSNPHGLS